MVLAEIVKNTLKRNKNKKFIHLNNIHTLLGNTIYPSETVAYRFLFFTLQKKKKSIRVHEILHFCKSIFTIFRCYR